MFTGPEALKSVSAAARAEILALFPALQQLDYEALPLGARAIATGRQGRKLAQRHHANAKALWS